LVICLQSSEFRGQASKKSTCIICQFLLQIKFYFCLSNVRIPVTFFFTTVVLIVSLSPSTIRTVRISPGEPPFVTMTKWPSSTKSSDSTSSSRKSEIFVMPDFILFFLLLCFVTFEMLNFSFLLITFVTKSTWNVSSSGNEKVTVVLKLTAIFLFAQPRPKIQDYSQVLYL